MAIFEMNHVAPSWIPAPTRKEQDPEDYIAPRDSSYENYHSVWLRVLAGYGLFIAGFVLVFAVIFSFLTGLSLLTLGCYGVAAAIIVCTFTAVAWYWGRAP